MKYFVIMEGRRNMMGSYMEPVAVAQTSEERDRILSEFIERNKEEKFIYASRVVDNLMDDYITGDKRKKQ